MAEADLSREPGAPVPAGTIDPELMNLKVRRRIGAVAAAAVVVLSVWMLVRLVPDLRFARQDAPAAVVDGKGALAAGAEAFVEARGELVLARAIRLRSSSGGLGMRLAPMVGTGEALWVTAPGTGGGPRREGAWRGRIRDLEAMPFDASLRAHARRAAPRYVTAAAWRATAASGSLVSVEGESLAFTDDAVVALDIARIDAARVVAVFGERHPDAAAWIAALTKAGLAPVGGAPEEVTSRAARFIVQVAGGPAAATRALDAADLWGATAEPVLDAKTTTVAALRTSGLDAFAGQVLPDDALLRVASQATPGPRRVLLVDEHPDDYWYVLPLVIALGLIALLFAWAFARAVRRDFLPAR